MKTSTMAIGSVSTLAVGALLLGILPFLTTRTISATKGAPWGSLTASDQAAAPSSDAEQNAKLVQLAALSSAAPAPVTPAVAQSTPAPTPVVASDQPVPPVASDQQASAVRVISLAMAQTTPTAVIPVPVQPAAIALAPTATVAVPDQPAAPQTAPAVVADRGMDASADKPDTADKSGGVNINTASADTMDRVFGLGHVGRTIVSHRPYRSANDLLAKRVLKSSDFHRIQSRIAVD